MQKDKEISKIRAINQAKTIQEAEEIKGISNRNRNAKTGQKLCRLAERKDNCRICKGGDMRIVYALSYTLFCIIFIVGTLWDDEFEDSWTRKLMLAVIALVMICQVASRIIN